jgi:hypothetical protein
MIIIHGHDMGLKWPVYGSNQWRESVVVVVRNTGRSENKVSKYAELTTILREQRFLIAALEEMGYRAELHQEGAHLIGYEGQERPEVANLVIRRCQLRPASNGRFVALLSEYDQAVGYDRAWLGSVQQLYKEKQTVAAAKAKGYIFKGKEVIQTAKGPQIRLQFVTR